MRVQVPLIVRLPVRWTLVEAHRVRERNLEQVVIARGERLHDLGQRVPLGVPELLDRPGVPLRQQHGLEWPHGPERHQRREVVVLAVRSSPRARARASGSRRAGSPCAGWYSDWAASSFAGSFGIVAVDQIWQCGCGLLAPIMSPRFSKICTWPIKAASRRGRGIARPRRRPRAGFPGPACGRP